MTSDLSRAVETARIVLGGRGPEPTALPALREIHLGKMEGLEFDRMKACFPELWGKRGEDFVTFPTPGGESFQDLYDRVVPCFENAVKESGETMLLVTHAGVNRVIICHALGLALNNLFRIGQDYACLNILKIDGDRTVLSAMNLVPDLSSPPAPGRFS